MSCPAAFYEAISKGDTNATNTFISGCDSALVTAISLMKLTMSWTDFLTDVRAKYVIDSLSIDPGKALKAQADQLEYREGAANKKIQCDQIQNTLRIKQDGVNTASSFRQSLFQLGNAVTGAQSYLTDLVKQKY